MVSDNPIGEKPNKRIKEPGSAQSESKLLEEALRASEEKYKLLAEHSADVIYKLDIVTEQYTYVSPSIEKMLGYTAQEALSLKACDTVTPASYAHQREKLLEAISNNISPSICPDCVEAHFSDIDMVNDE